MATTPVDMTLADLLDCFGPIRAARIRYDPPPGTASEADVVLLESQEHRLFELVQGVLVEKCVGFYESVLAMRLAGFLMVFVERLQYGIVAGADGMLRLAPGLVRIPDISFISWERLPQRRVPRQPIPDLVPDLVVEVLSEGNTPREMEQKLTEYFSAGVRLIWYVQPTLQEVHVYTAPEASTIIALNQSLDGGSVLPGFDLPLRQLFRDPLENTASSQT